MKNYINHNIKLLNSLEINLLFQINYFKKILLF